MDTDLRLPVFTLFDDQIGSIYHRFGIGKGAPNHVKSAKLHEAEREVLNNFDEITDRIVNLGSANTQRQPFMQALNFEKNKLFLEQFVTRKLIDRSRIGEVFETAIAYNESSMVDRVTSYQNLETVFNPFLDEAAKNPSIFTKRCIVAPVKKMYDFIRDDFEKNDAIQPATVTISPLDHKYPFHEKDRKIKLKFLVKNKGPGYSFDIQIECDGVDKGLTQFYPVSLGTLAPKKSSEIILETTVEDQIEESPVVMGKISWWNFDRSKRGSSDFIVSLTPQRRDLDWDALRFEQPYSLAAIIEAENLVGRRSLIRQLNNRLFANEIESSIIHGQKRVGKTSIAKVIQANFNKDPNYVVISVPIIDLDTSSSENFVANLGETIVEEMSLISMFKHIKTPKFNSSLAPLTAYFRSVHQTAETYRFIIILDEFDEIPSDMIQIGNNIGRTFFNNIRGMNHLGYVGFILVGGENMQIIREAIDQLNAMSVFQVDYFDKDQYWLDFQDLVRKPVEDTIEFNDAAINALYEITEGHPFYTKLICQEIYETACNERNAYITKDNVDKAVQMLIKTLDLNRVSHLWIDGINKRRNPNQQDQIQTHRRKFLIAFAQIKRSKNNPLIQLGVEEKNPNRQDLQASEILKDVPVDRIIDKYITRGFLIEEKGHYRWKPRFFERWLIERGFSMLTGEFLDEEAIAHLREEEEKAYVPDTDILDLCSRWESYRGSEITPTHVRVWLEQFEYNTEQRLMFNLLKHIRFYKESQSREKIRVLHKAVQAKLAQKGVIRPWKDERKDILLSSFGSPAKSGSSYARIYAQENNIFDNNIVHFSDIPKKLHTKSGITAIVFVDDIIGSGGSAVASLNNLDAMCGKLISGNEVTVFISAICGLHTGIDKLEKAIAKVPFDAEVVDADRLTEADQCFTKRSEVFSSEGERDSAKQIALQKGKELERKQPLGYDNSQLLVAFHDSCPNNTLPILWKESTGKVKWTPLFKRN